MGNEEGKGTPGSGTPVSKSWLNRPALCPWASCSICASRFPRVWNRADIPGLYDESWNRHMLVFLFHIAQKLLNILPLRNHPPSCHSQIYQFGVVVFFNVTIPLLQMHTQLWQVSQGSMSWAHVWFVLVWHILSTLTTFLILFQPKRISQPFSCRKNWLILLTSSPTSPNTYERVYTQIYKESIK